DDFRASIAQFQSRHGDQPGITTKTRLDSELYLDEDLFYDLEAEFDQIADIRVLYRGDEFKNELRYRCDVLFHVQGPAEGPHPLPLSHCDGRGEPLSHSDGRGESLFPLSRRHGRGGAAAAAGVRAGLTQRLCQKRLWTCWHFEQLAESNLAAP